MLLGTPKTPKWCGAPATSAPSPPLSLSPRSPSMCCRSLVTPVAWLLSRAVTGFVLAGVYAVVESWINGIATNDNRGGLYAVYSRQFRRDRPDNCSCAAGSATAFLPFMVGSALFGARHRAARDDDADPPDLPRIGADQFAPPRGSRPIRARRRLRRRRRQRRLVFAGARLCAGDRRSSPERCPIHRRDRGGLGARGLSRRRCRTASIGGWSWRPYGGGRRFEFVLRLLIRSARADRARLLVGLTTYTLYTLAVSLANDGAAPHDMVLISAGLLFIYCVGAIVRRRLLRSPMHAFGPVGAVRQNAIVPHRGALRGVFASAGSARPRRWPAALTPWRP